MTKAKAMDETMARDWDATRANKMDAKKEQKSG